MPSKGKNYGNASQVTTHIDSYADGGKVEVPKVKKNPLPPPKKGGKPKKIGEGMGSPGGPHTPGEKGTYPMADGGKVAKKKKKKRKPKPEMLGTGSASDAGRSLGGRQRQIDKALEDAGA